MNIKGLGMIQRVLPLLLTAIVASAGEAPVAPTPATPQPVASPNQPPPAIAPAQQPVPIVPQIRMPAQPPIQQPPIGQQFSQQPHFAPQGPIGFNAPPHGPELPDVKDMTNPAYLLGLAGIHLQFGAIDRAEPLLKTALEKSKDPNQKLAITQALGQCLERKGDNKGAAEQFESAYNGATNPSEKAQLGLALAGTYLRLGDADKAQSIALEVAKPDKARFDEPNIQQNVLHTLTEIWQAKPALLDAYLADAEAALAKEPNDTVLLQRLSDIYSNVKHDPVKAASYSERIAAAHPDDKMAQYRLAASYQQSKQFDKAIDLYKKLMAAPGERKDEVRSQAFQVGMMMLQAGKKDDAVAWIKDNYVKDMTLSRDYSMVSMFYEQAGMNAEAEESLNKQAELAKAPDEKVDAKLRIADMAFRKKDYDKAESVAKAVEVEFKDNMNAQNRATAMIKRVEFEKSRPAGGAPIVAVKPASTPPAGQPQGQDTKPLGPVLPTAPAPDVKPRGPTGNAPVPVKAEAEMKPSVQQPNAPAPDAK